jgi:hypothetical protein
MKPAIISVTLVVALCFSSCVSQANAAPVKTVPADTASVTDIPASLPGAPDAETAPVYPLGSLSLDEAIGDIAAYFTGRLPEGSTLAIVSFEADTGGLGTDGGNTAYQ